MNLETLNTVLGIVASSLAIIVLVAGSRVPIKGRPRTHLVILVGSLLALLLVSLGFLLGTLPKILPADVRYASANGLVVGGLLITCLVWFPSLWISFQLKRWIWFVSLLLGGLIPYTFALIYAFTSFFANTFLVGLAYLFACVGPGIFGYWGPISSKEV